jgi:hypothetical protein
VNRTKATTDEFASEAARGVGRSVERGRLGRNLVALHLFPPSVDMGWQFWTPSVDMGRPFWVGSGVELMRNALLC